MSSAFSLSILTPGGQELTLEGKPDMRVSDLAALVDEKAPASDPEEQRRLVYHGDVMEPRKTLADYNLDAFTACFDYTRPKAPVAEAEGEEGEEDCADEGEAEAEAEGEEEAEEEEPEELDPILPLLNYELVPEAERKNPHRPMTMKEILKDFIEDYEELKAKAEEKKQEEAAARKAAAASLDSARSAEAEQEDGEPAGEEEEGGGGDEEGEEAGKEAGQGGGTWE